MKKLIALLTFFILLFASLHSFAENDSQYLWGIALGSSLETTKTALESLTGCTLDIVESDNGTRALRNSHKTKGHIPELEGHDILGLDCMFYQSKPVADQNGQMSIQIVPGGLSDLYIAWEIGETKSMTGVQAVVMCNDIYKYLYNLLGGDLTGYFVINFNKSIYYCPAYRNGGMSMSLLDWVLEYDTQNELCYIKDNCEIRISRSGGNWFMTFHESNRPIFLMSDRVKDLLDINGLPIPDELRNE